MSTEKELSKASGRKSAVDAIVKPPRVLIACELVEPCEKLLQIWAVMPGVLICCRPKSLETI